MNSNVQDNLPNEAWATFCVSTYKRPVLLKNALEIISKQTFRHFKVVVCDNDPEGSAGPVVKNFNDARFKYFLNGENLGMIPSYNKSIQRAETEYIVMITDDDPVAENFLEELYEQYKRYPGYSAYCGFQRSQTSHSKVELIAAKDFIIEILDWNKTPSILWSSCVLKRSDVIHVGSMPDKGIHLTDHALIAMTGSINGGVIINKMYSSLSNHENNFSKLNFDYYVIGCKEFYSGMLNFCSSHTNFKEEKNAVIMHLGKWFITCMFNLKKYYTLKKNQEMLMQVDLCSAKIISFPFMQQFKFKYYSKLLIFNIKRTLNLLR